MLRQNLPPSPSMGARPTVVGRRFTHGLRVSETVGGQLLFWLSEQERQLHYNNESVSRCLTNEPDAERRKAVSQKGKTRASRTLNRVTTREVARGQRAACRSELPAMLILQYFANLLTNAWCRSSATCTRCAVWSTVVRTQRNLKAPNWESSGFLTDKREHEACRCSRLQLAE